jgi:hypothetical protein
MGGGRDWRDDADRFDEPQPLRRRIRSRDDTDKERDDEDFYRPRRSPARAAIPERAASRDDWGRERDRDRDPAGAAAPSTSRFRAGSAPESGSGREFGARRQGRDETRRGSRPVSSSDDLPRSSRRPGAPEGRPSGVPQGAPYRPPASAPPSEAPELGVSDAEFRPVPPSSRPGGTGGPAPRDNSSRFDD